MKIVYEGAYQMISLEEDSKMLEDYPFVPFLLEQGKTPEKCLELACHLQWKVAEIDALGLFFNDRHMKLFVYVIEFPDSHIQDDLTGALLQSYIMADQIWCTKYSWYSREGFDMELYSSRNGEEMSNFGLRWNGMTSEEKRAIAFDCNENHETAYSIAIKDDIVSSIIPQIALPRPNTFYNSSEEWRRAKERGLQSEEQEQLTKMLSSFNKISGVKLNLGMDYMWIAINSNRILLAEYQDTLFDE